MAVCTGYRDPVEVKLVRLENGGNLGSRKITVEFTKPDSDTMWWSQVEVQYRLGGRWLEAKGLHFAAKARFVVAV